MSRAPRGTLEHAFLFAQWALALPRPPSLGDVEAFLGCDRATARRWRHKWLTSLRAPGQVPLPAERHAVGDGNRAAYHSATERKAP